MVQSGQSMVVIQHNQQGQQVQYGQQQVQPGKTFMMFNMYTYA